MHKPLAFTASPKVALARPDDSFWSTTSLSALAFIRDHATDPAEKAALALKHARLTLAEDARCAAFYRLAGFAASPTLDNCATVSAGGPK